MYTTRPAVCGGCCVFAAKCLCCGLEGPLERMGFKRTAERGPAAVASHFHPPLLLHLLLLLLLPHVSSLRENTLKNTPQQLRFHPATARDTTRWEAVRRKKVEFLQRFKTKKRHKLADTQQPAKKGEKRRDTKTVPTVGSPGGRAAEKARTPTGCGGETLPFGVGRVTD